MSKYLDIPASRISVVPLGISMDGYDPTVAGAGFSRPEGRPFTIGYFARVAPEKGLHVLADAYVRLRRRTAEMPMRLEAAGYLARANRAYLDAVRRTLDEGGVGGEFSYAGEVDREGKLAFLRRLDVLSSSFRGLPSCV